MKLTNPRTGDNFTEEQAGSWLLAEQQKLNQQIEQLETSAQRVAEVNLGLKADAQRVVDKHGELLGRNPELAKKAQEFYEKTLVKDPKTGITMEAPMDLIGFYDVFLDPYIQAELRDGVPAPVVEKPKANPSDRADLPTTNGNSNLSKQDQEWADIAKEYQGQRN
jgi:hypothetical protein